MFRRFLSLLLVLGCMAIIIYGKPFELPETVSPTLILGFMLLAAYCVGSILEGFGLPRITGYICAGLFLGPYFLKFYSKNAVSDLSFLNSLALAFIAFCAGGELRLANIKKKLPGEWRRGSTWKARRIAVTEVNSASNTSSFKAADQLGYNMNKFWICAPRGVAKKERHTIMGVNGQKRAMKEPFDIGISKLMHPGDSSLGADASDIINCHCTVTYEVI